ncbi:zinc finger protein 382-like isoform X1 [Bacillus rossius redtenbacheri]|uniref:zinc finger protein 382-like isoform X1 n=1 Tax=Bacillus rossius redtenbacheri TaxID=93214 RepID=UPI002FDDE443
MSVITSVQLIATTSALQRDRITTVTLNRALKNYIYGVKRPNQAVREYMPSAPGTRPHPPDGAGTHRGRCREDGAFRSRVRDRQDRAAGRGRRWDVGGLQCCQRGGEGGAGHPRRCVAAESSAGVSCASARTALRNVDSHGNSSAYRHLEEDETQHAKALGLDRELTPRSGCSLKPAWLQAWSLGLEKKHQEERVPASHETLGSPAANTTTTEKCFACSLCYAKFAREDHLSIHMRTHSSEKLFPCLICSAKFRVRSFLNDHVKTHTSAKLFSCSTCSAQFNVKSYLNEHIKTHAGEKLFACSECSAKFTTLIGLNVHMRTHTG